jgi:hypothetical protein
MICAGTISLGVSLSRHVRRSDIQPALHQGRMLNLRSGLLLVFLILVLLCGESVAVGQPRAVSSRTQGVSLSFWKYEPRHINSLNELPNDIRLAVISHLTARLGSDFFKKLTFVEGVIINLDELYKLEPERKNYHWKMPSYELHFSFSDLTKGIRSYRTYVQLDERGNVLKDVGLPEISKRPEKASILPLNEAVRIAVENNFPRKKMSLSLDYDKDADSIIWIVEGPHQDHKTYGCNDILEIDAHTAKILKHQPQCGIY